jgi:FlaA1/EpsC-like NDP-sugar epimerase
MDKKLKLKYGGIYAGDLLSVYAALFLSLLFGGAFNLAAASGGSLLLYILAMFVIFNLTFFIVRYYRDSIFNFDAFSAIILGASLAFIHAIFHVFCAAVGLNQPIQTLLIALVFSCFLCGTYRICAIAGGKLIHRYILRERGCDAKRIIVFGAGEAGKFLAAKLAYDSSRKMKIVAYIDDNPQLHGRYIKGCPVAGGRNDIAAAVKKYRADSIIIAIPHVDNSNFREIVELCCKTGCKVQRFANLSDLNMSDLSKATINDINIEDLLGREPVKLSLKGVHDLLLEKVVLVTGGAGSIGSEICRQVLAFGAGKVIALDIHENGLFALGNELRKKYPGRLETVVGSIKDKARLDEVMAKYRPNIVFHAAAYKHVPMMEQNPIEAVANNVYGTYNTMLSAVEHQVENFTMISTDKAVNPTNVMGATKRITELLCKWMSVKCSQTKFSAVRFGNVLGSNGSVIPIFEEQIRKGGPVTVTDREIKRYFMTIPEAVQLVMEASSISKGGELFVLDMGTMVKIYDLAVAMIRLAGLEPEKDIKIEITGLRPGEKMYEELQMDTESLTKTSNDRIFVFDSEHFDAAKFERDFKNLDAAMKSRDLKAILTQIKELVPTYLTSDYIHAKYLRKEPPEPQSEPVYTKPGERLALTAS